MSTTSVWQDIKRGVVHLLGQVLVQFPDAKMKELLERVRYRLRNFDLFDAEFVSLMKT